MKIIFYTLLAYILIGCGADKQPKKNIENNQTRAITKPVKVTKTKEVVKINAPVKITKVKTSRSNMVRGIILSQIFIEKENTWLYNIKVVDILNDNAGNLKFKYYKKLHDVGDLVYAIFRTNNRITLKNLYLIEKNYKQESKAKTTTKEKLANIKRAKGRKTPWIKPPVVETVLLK